MHEEKIKRWIGILGINPIYGDNVLQLGGDGLVDAVEAETFIAPHGLAFQMVHPDAKSQENEKGEQDAAAN